ncbi:hypothetical protein DWUX_2645 [Desulfovibrio diazotrophicus]|nr:hypothetical protein DWUX_2645 [Desulfovibrio diazotrophicus]
MRTILDAWRKYAPCTARCPAGGPPWTSQIRLPVRWRLERLFHLCLAVFRKAGYGKSSYRSQKALGRTKGGNVAGIPRSAVAG